MPPRTLELRTAGTDSIASVKLRVTGPKGYEKVVRVSGAKSLRKLRPGVYRVSSAGVAIAGVTYAPAKAVMTATVSAKRGARVKVSFRSSGPVGPDPTPTPIKAPAPASAPPAGAISEVLERINAARAAGVRCDGTTGPALPPIGYSAELGALAQWHAEDFAAGRPNEFIADLNRSGYSGSFMGESAVVCPKVADPQGVFVAMRDWSASCEHLFDPRIDRIGIGYAQNSASQNAWVLTFGLSTI